MLLRSILKRLNFNIEFLLSENLNRHAVQVNCTRRFHSTPIAMGCSRCTSQLSRGSCGSCLFKWNIRGACAYTIRISNCASLLHRSLSSSLYNSKTEASGDYSKTYTIIDHYHNHKTSDDCEFRTCHS